MTPGRNGQSGHMIPGSQKSMIHFSSWDTSTDIFIPEFLAGFMLLIEVGSMQEREQTS